MRKFLFAAFSVCLSLGVLTQTALAAQRSMNFITIGVAPWAFLDKASGQNMGVFPAVVSELERRTGIQIRQAYEPFARIDHELETGAQDCTILVWADSRARIVERGELVASHPMGVIARRGVKLSSYDDLKGKTISVLRGLAIEPRFDGDNSIIKDSDSDYVLGVRKMAHQRVDGVAGAVPTIQYLARQEGLEQYLGDRLMLADTPLVLQCSKKSANLDLLPALNKAIRQMREDGTIDRIKSENLFM
ncbi:MAG TPA: transporter substrate-binding domain-containing protein [Candidatus Sulfotelmatobacter sp.]|nr:transporter substrate-binding domain-containing protein [Candidatus Sulfotelmatobacter sp.]